MKRLFILGVLVCAAQLLLMHSAQAMDAKPCTDEQLVGYTPDFGDIAAHRSFTLPVISYPFGTEKSGWGLILTVRVDETGHVVCYRSSDQFGENQPLDDKRRAEIERLATWRYEPFRKEGHAVVAVFQERIAEQELPQKHLPLPKVPLSKVHIALSRGACFGSCPVYRVDIYGDGRVVYKGETYVDVEGEHSYRVPTEEVAALIKSLDEKDIWSLREDYNAPITDNPTHALMMDMGGQIHHLGDYVGQMVGMPPVVSEFEVEVDKVARSDMWIHLSQSSLEKLQEEGFKFDSQEGADLFARANANADSKDTTALLSLIELGAPVSGAHPQTRGFLRRAGSPLEEALINRREALVDALIAKGALNTDGKPDQAKIDAAFRAAIRGGRLPQVQKIWGLSGTSPHPSLTFYDKERAKKSLPVTLLLRRERQSPSDWHGAEIAKWLVAQGCDIKGADAEGTTLLQIAVSSGDANFVRYLLDQGLDASTPGRFGLPVLAGAENEDVALALLEAAPGTFQMDESGRRFREYAESRHWTRVIALLDAKNGR